MLAESHASAQLVASRAYSRRSLPRSLRLESQPEEPAAPSTPTSFSWSSFRWYLCSAALLCLPFFFKIFDFKLYGALLSGGMLAVQLFVRLSFLWEQAAFRTRAAASAFRTLSSVALGSLSPRSLTSNLSSYLCSSLGSFDHAEEELSAYSQLCSKRQLQLSQLVLKQSLLSSFCPSFILQHELGQRFVSSFRAWSGTSFNGSFEL